jgi:predicted transglutaminase-like cysteine proteinase
MRALIYVLWLCALVLPANAEGTKRAFMTEGSVTLSPTGYIMFCHNYPARCIVPKSEPYSVVMTDALWSFLDDVNHHVNYTVEPVTDQAHWGHEEQWDLPYDGKGDCEDYVLYKQKLLLDAKWPREALLITVVRDKKGEGHAVLVVSTSTGEYVLDNMTEAMLPWYETGYTFVKRQSQTSRISPKEW